MANSTKIFQEYGHYRWVCTCGSKGIHLIYKRDVERLAAEHMKKKHLKQERHYVRIPYYRIDTFQCNECGCLVTDHVLHDRWHNA
jgi:hypothetical protein